MSFYIVSPIESWPVEPTPEYKRRSRWTFKAKWSDTILLLEDELARLKANSVVLQLDVDQRHIRNDGGLYANASPRSPGVIVSFDSMHGPLSYPCDSCESWQHNVRSIALALQALRAVDRYGVTGRAEQYRGWTKIAQPGQLMGFATAKKAWEFIHDLVGDKRVGLNGAETIRRALTMAHPDNGGTTERFKLATAAKAKIMEGSK